MNHSRDYKKYDYVALCLHAYIIYLSFVSDISTPLFYQKIIRTVK